MHPVAKVKSRLSLHVPDNADTIFCQSDLISPIGRMNLSPCPGGKVSFHAVKCLFIFFLFTTIFSFLAFPIVLYVAGRYQGRRDSFS
jgi:hypothetical protein